jgi:hypothetical protein
MDVQSFHFWGRLSLGGRQCLAKEYLDGQFLLAALGGIREGLQHLQPLAEVTDGLMIGRALKGTLARPLPILHPLLPKARRGVVMRQEFGLRLGRLGKLCLQNLDHALMILLPRALEQ